MNAVSIEWLASLTAVEQRLFGGVIVGQLRTVGAVGQPKQPTKGNIRRLIKSASLGLNLLVDLEIDLDLSQLDGAASEVCDYTFNLLYSVKK